MRKNYIINHGSVFDNKIVDIFESDSKLFFLGDKVNILEDGRYKFINLVELKNNINDITNYGMDSILIASKSNGVYKWSDNNLENKYMTKDGLLSNNIYQIESTGRYIFAVSKYGVSVIDERTQTVNNLKGIDYYNILNMEVYEDLLILQKKDGLVIKSLNEEEKLTISATDLLNDILTDIIIVDKRVYISGNQGITSYNLENNNIENVVNFHYKINDILYYNDLIYIGSDSGLYYYNLKEGEISDFRENDELSSKKILKIINLDECVFIKTEDGVDVIL